MTIRIDPVDGRASTRLFAAVPRVLHGQDPRWLPPLPGDTRRALDPRWQPTLRPGRWRRWVAIGERGPVGRIAAFAPEHRRGVGYFGFFESDHRHVTAAALLGTAVTWLAVHQCTTVHGPLPITARDGIGLLVSGHDGPATYGCPWNPGHYPTLLEQCGLQPTVRLRSYRWRPDLIDHQRLRSLVARGRDSGRFRVRPVNARRLKRELREIVILVNETLADAWHYEPITMAEADVMARQLAPVLDPEMALLVEDDAGPCGVALAIPDPNWLWHRAGGRLWPTGWWTVLAERRRIPHLRVLALGVAARCRGSTVVAQLLDAWLGRAAAAGYQSAELAQVFDDNLAMCRLLDHIRLPIHRRFAVYSCPIPA